VCHADRAAGEVGCDADCPPSTTRCRSSHSEVRRRRACICSARRGVVVRRSERIRTRGMQLASVATPERAVCRRRGPASQTLTTTRQREVGWISREVRDGAGTRRMRRPEPMSCDVAPAHRVRSNVIYAVYNINQPHSGHM